MSETFRQTTSNTEERFTRQTSQHARKRVSQFRASSEGAQHCPLLLLYLGKLPAVTLWGENIEMDLSVIAYRRNAPDCKGHRSTSFLTEICGGVGLLGNSSLFCCYSSSLRRYIYFLTKTKNTIFAEQITMGEAKKRILFHCLSELKSHFLLLLVVMTAFAQAFQRNYTLWQDLKEWFLCEISGMVKGSENRSHKRKLILVLN